MTSKMSFCNRAIIKKGLLRGAPLWGSYLLIWLIALPMSLLSTEYRFTPMLNMQQTILSCAVSVSSVIPFFYGLASACLLFSYLYRSRSANFFGALPLTRDQLFLSNYVTGLLYAVGPNVIIAVCTSLAVLPTSAALVVDVLQWLLAATLGYVFYYSFAVFCAMIVGHLIALPLLYVVLHFTAVVVEAIVRELLSAFVYGMYFNGGVALTFLSPLVHQLDGGGLDVRTIWQSDITPNWTSEKDPIVGYVLENWQYTVILAIVGIVFAAAAFWLHKKRRLESAGDVIAIRHLKPVFLYGFTLGCSLVIGWILASMLVSGFTTENFLPILLCMLTGAILGFFAGQMMLQKTLRVFQKGNWLRCAASCGVVILLMLGCRLDLFGYAGYVPDPDDVASISVSYYDADYQDPQFIERVTEFHRDILDRREETETLNRYADLVPTVRLTYVLKDGSSIARRYEIPVNADTASDPDSLIRQYEAIMNDPGYIVKRELVEEITLQNLTRGYLFLNTKEDFQEIYLSAEQTYDLLQNGVIPDLRAARIGGIWYTDRFSDPSSSNSATEAVTKSVTEVYNSVELQIDFRGGNSQYLSIPPEATQTIQTLIDMGLIEADYYEQAK